MPIDFVPRPWQKPIIKNILDKKRSCVFAGMGLGKTTSALTTIDLLLLTGQMTAPTLVCAPLRVAQSVWPNEAKKWKHLSNIEMQTISGSPKERMAALNNPNASVFTINYEILPWLVETIKDEKRAWPFGNVIADESTKLKGFRTRQGGARAKALGKVAYKTERWTNLTGTPSPNGLQDLWGQMWFVDGGMRLGNTYTAFEQRWFKKGFDGFSTQALPHAEKEIHALIKDVCLSLDIADFMDIKKPICFNIYVTLPKKAKALYKDMERKMFLSFQGHDVEAFSAAEKTMKCLQLASGAIYVDDPESSEQETKKTNREWALVHDEKIAALGSIVSEAAGTPVLVSYYFKSDLDRLQKAFPEGRKFDGNPKTESDWNQGKIPLLFVHPKSAGHGLNLQDGGNILVFFSNDWNLEEYLQIIERIGPTRQMQSGHNRPVYVYHIIAKDTIDELVMVRRETKRSVQDILMEALK